MIIILTSSTCKICLPTEYILNPFLNCRPCPSEGICIQGILKLQYGDYFLVFCSFIALLGFWRASKNTDVIYRCYPYSESCRYVKFSTFIKSNREDDKGSCIEGYAGPICQTCETVGSIYYSKQIDFKCYPCHDLELQTFIILLLFILYLTFYLFVIK